MAKLRFRSNPWWWVTALGFIGIAVVLLIGWALSEVGSSECAFSWVGGVRALGVDLRTGRRVGCRGRRTTSVSEGRCGLVTDGSYAVGSARVLGTLRIVSGSLTLTNDTPGSAVDLLDTEGGTLVNKGLLRVNGIVNGTGSVINDGCLASEQEAPAKGCVRRRPPTMSPQMAPRRAVIVVPDAGPVSESEAITACASYVAPRHLTGPFVETSEAVAIRTAWLHFVDLVDKVACTPAEQTRAQLRAAVKMMTPLACQMAGSLALSAARIAGQSARVAGSHSAASIAASRSG